MSTQIQDGTVKWETKDIRVKAIVDLMYPVGTVIAVANDNTPAFTKYGTWSKIGNGCVLWGADSSHSAGTTIEPGLPNITGTLTHEYRGRPINDTGAISFTPTGGTGEVNSGGDPFGILSFDASKSNSIYGKSTTVQPPAYVVTFWRRTA